MGILEKVVNKPTPTAPPFEKEEEQEEEVQLEENEEEVTPEEETEAEKPEEKSIDPKFQALDAQKRQWREKAENLEKEVAKLKKVKTPDGKLEVDDYIDISASLDGLDQKEKEKLSREHKLTGEPLSEIRKNKVFALSDFR